MAGARQRRITRSNEFATVSEDSLKIWLVTGIMTGVFIAATIFVTLSMRGYIIIEGDTLAPLADCLERFYEERSDVAVDHLEAYRECRLELLQEGE